MAQEIKVITESDLHQEDFTVKDNHVRINSKNQGVIFGKKGGGVYGYTRSRSTVDCESQDSFAFCTARSGSYAKAIGDECNAITMGVYSTSHAKGGWASTAMSFGANNNTKCGRGGNFGLCFGNGNSATANWEDYNSAFVVAAGRNNSATAIGSGISIALGNNAQANLGEIVINSLTKFHTTGKHYAESFETQSDERIKNVLELIKTKDNGLKIYRFQYIETGLECIGLIAQEAKQLLQSKGYSESVINNVFNKVRGKDWIQTIAEYNKEFFSNVRTYPELMDDFKNRKENKRISLGIREASLEDFIKSVEEIEEDSRSNWQKERYTEVKKFLDESRWDVFTDDILCINYNALELLL